MIKTNEHNASFNDLTVDTAGLQALTHAGIKTATEIGVAAGAKIYVGRTMESFATYTWVAVFFLLIVTVLSFISRYVERRMNA